MQLITRVLCCDPASIHFSHSKSAADTAFDRLEEPKLLISDEMTLKNLKEAADLLLNGNQIVAMPTETVYGLAGDATNDKAIQKIYQVKRRPSDNPLICHVSSMKMLRDFCVSDNRLPSIYLPLVDRFWPGPLTILVPKSPRISASVWGLSDSVETVGVRFPSNPISRALISLTGRPLAAPSANLSGKPSATTAQHVITDFDGELPVILSDLVSSHESSFCQYGLESTVIDALSVPPVILRPGGITLEMVRQVPGFEDTVMFSKHSSQDIPTTPGMKYRHYAPVNSQVLLLEQYDGESISCFASRFGKFIHERVLELFSKERELSFGIIGFLPVDIDSEQEIVTQNSFYSITKHCQKIEEDHVVLQDFHVFTPEDHEVALKAYGKNIFYALRWLDEVARCDYIFIHGVEEVGIGAAIMNRVRKSARMIY